MSRQSKTTKAVASADTHRSGGRSFERIAWQFGPPHLANLTVPAAGLLAHAAWGGEPVATPLATLGMAGGTIFLSLLAHRIGRAREEIVRWHTTTTVALAGAGVTLATILGFDGGIKSTLLQVMWGAGSIVAFSWNLRKIDSLRQGDGATQVEQDKWGHILGLPGTTPGQVKQVGARVEATLHHGGGETVRNAQNALPAIEAAAGVPAGRSRIVENPDDASKSTLVLVTADVLRDTIPWPGPSAPGGCISEPMIAGLYEDELPAQFWLPGKPGRAPTNLLSMGMTRAGKTQCSLVMTTDQMTRRNVAHWWADATKGAQTAGPIEAGLDWYIESVAGTKAMLAAAKEVVRARADALGRAGYRQWTPEAFDDPRLRMPYLVIHLEEADELIASSDTFTWLTGKALSTGVSISVSLQRADHGSMPTTARYNIGGVLCFGVGDDYSAGFALSQATLDAGARPEKWKATKQGYFYLEAPGVDETRFPVPARAFYATDDELAAVVAAHAHVRAPLDAISQKAAGSIYAGRLTAGTSPSTSMSAPTKGPEMTEEEAEDAQDNAESLASMPPQPEPEIAATCDPSEPIPAFTGPDLAFGAPKPAAGSKEAAEAAFDAAVTELANQGAQTVKVRQIFELMKVRSDTWISRRLSAVAEGAIVSPPGVTLERTDTAGEYTVRVLAGAGMR